MNEQEEFEFRKRMEDEQAAQPAPTAALPPPAANIPVPPTQEEINNFRKPKSGYAGIPEDQLAWWQKADRALAMPGHEMLSPGSLSAKREALEHGANTLAFGYLPQIVGRFKGGAFGTPEYLKARDEMVAKLASADPGTKLTGTALGVLPTLGAGSLLKSAATVPGRIAQAAGVGALQAGLANPGDTPGEFNPTQLGARGQNALKGGALAGTLATVANLPQLTDRIKQGANYRAVKQGGAMLKDFRTLDNKGTLDTTGQMMMTPLDGPEGPIQVVTPGVTLEQVADRTGKLMEHHGKMIGAVQDALDQNFSKMVLDPQLSQVLPNPHAMAEAIEKQLIAPNEGVVAMKSLMPQLQEYVEQLRAMPNAPMSFGNAKQQLKGFDNVINWDKLGGPGKELQKQVRGIINGQIETAVDAVGQASNFPLYDKWKRAKQIYGNMAQMNSIANDKILRDTANRYISPSDYGVGGAATMAAAAAHGHLGPEQIALGIGAAGANHVMRKYGNSVTALGANNLSSALATPNMQQASQFLSQQVQPATTAAVQSSAPPNPAKFRSDVTSKLANTPYAAQLATAKSDQDFALRYFALSQSDPNFRAALEGKQPSQ